MRLKAFILLAPLWCLGSVLFAAPVDDADSFASSESALYIWAPTADHFVEAPVPMGQVGQNVSRTVLQEEPMYGRVSGPCASISPPNPISSSNRCEQD